MKPILSRSGIYNCNEFVSTVPVPDANIINAAMWSSFSGRAAVSQSMPPVIDLSGDFRNRKIGASSLQGRHFIFRNPKFFLENCTTQSPPLPKIFFLRRTIRPTKNVTFFFRPKIHEECKHTVWNSGP